MVDALGDKLTRMITTNLEGIDQGKAEIINYGLKCLISDISKTIIIFTFAYFLGVLALAIAYYFSFGLLRIFAGGVHAKKSWECLITTSGLLFFTIYISILLSNFPAYLGYLYFLIFIINSVIIFKYAPADLENKPIVSKKIRERFRIRAVFALGLVIVFALTIIKEPNVQNVLVIATFAESITLLPISYKIFGCKHGQII